MQKHFQLVPGSDKAIRIGRAPGNDLQIEHRGASQYHAEIRLLAGEDDDDKPRLCVRDLSMNGTGLKRHEDKEPVQIKKGEDERIYHGSSILVPMLLKIDQSPDERAQLRVSFDEPEGQEPPEEDEESKQNGKAKSPSKKKLKKKEPSEESGDGEKDDEDGEQDRMQFVDLLMKTKEISAGTTFEEARGLLSHKSQWKAVDEDTRKECFDIFVEHLGSHTGKKSKKKDKNKAKSKDKKRKHKDEDEEEEDEEESRKATKKDKKKRRDGSKKRGKRQARSDSD